MNKIALPSAIAIFSAIAYFIFQDNQISETVAIPERMEEKVFDKEKTKLKLEDWSIDAANHHQKMLKKYKHVLQGNTYRAPGDIETFGTLKGGWKNRGPKNMPGAFKFAEMLDGTDTIYGVTHNHYSGEFNSKSFIYKGTIYNPKTGTAGDDFVNLTPNWPNRYKNLMVFRYNGSVRLVVGIENGPVSYSDDEGQSWNTSSNGPTLAMSTIINRQDGRVYSTDGIKVYVSTDGGGNFTVLHDFGSGSYTTAVLYSPRYDVQPDAEEVYLARSGSFYELNGAKTSFTLKGSYGSTHTSSTFSIG